MDDEGLFDDDPVLSRRERLRVQREAAHQAPTRVGLRFTAAAAVVVGLLVWLVVSWLTSSPSASDQLPEDPALRPEPGAPSGQSAPSRSSAGTGGSTAAESLDPAEASRSPQTSSTAGPVIVHVAGAVDRPGVVELAAGARVLDAVEAAGGLSEDAAPEGINLAAEAVDGAYLHVPTVEELASGDVGGMPAGPGGATPGGAGADDREDAPIDLNSADAEALQRLTGIGPALAERIVEHRTTVGPFDALEELAGVPGIGPATLDEVEDEVTW